MRAVTIVAAMALGASVLAGCVAEPEPTTPSAAPAPSATNPTESAPPSTGAPETPDLVGTPLTLECSSLLTPDALYAFNPNVGTDPTYAPTDLARQALDLDGIACGWLNQTSAVTYSVAVAQLDPPSMTILRDAARAPESVDLPSAEGYFTVDNAGGSAYVFIGDYWVIIESPEFIAPGDPSTLIEALTASLS